MGMLNFMDWLRKPTLIKSMSLNSIFMVGNETKEGYVTEGITLAQLTSSLQTLTIPKLHLHTEAGTRLGVTLMPTSASDLWTNLNPRIYLFHYRKTKGRKRKQGGKEGGSKTSKYRKGGFLHPTHMNGINFSNSKFYSGGTDIPYHTEYDMNISKGYETQMLDDFNPFEFYSYRNDAEGIYFKPLPRGLIASNLNMINISGKNANTLRKGNRSNYFKFAIGVDNPDPNSAFPIIFGEMTDTVQSLLYINQNMVDVRFNIVPNGIKRAIVPTGAAKA
jgi:hypothetical protein